MDNLWIMIWLVVEPTPLKNMKVSWDYHSQYMEKQNVPNHQPAGLPPKKKDPPAAALVS